MPSKKQKEVIDSLRKHNGNLYEANKELGINVGSSLTKFFSRFMEDLQVMDENYEVFERRLKARPEAYTTLRRLARKIKS